MCVFVELGVYATWQTCFRVCCECGQVIGCHYYFLPVHALMRRICLTNLITGSIVVLLQLSVNIMGTPQLVPIPCPSGGRRVVINVVITVVLYGNTHMYFVMLFFGCYMYKGLCVCPLPNISKEVVFLLNDYCV